MRRILVAAILLGCGHNKTNHADPSAPQKVRYQDVVSRLPSYLENGWVVSRGTDGTIEHTGDSLIWSGLALYALDCEDGEPVAKAFEAMIDTGNAYRYPGLEDPVSLDGLSGFFRGVAKRVTVCGETERWKKLAVFHYPPLPLSFGYVRDKLYAKLGINDLMGSTQAKLETEVVAWASAVRASKKSCFRVNVGIINLQSVEELGGKISDLARASFCPVVRGMDLPTADHFCGGNLSAFLDSFQYNRWEYRHQRCPAWESPDGNGFETPGIDYLVAYRDQIGG